MKVYQIITVIGSLILLITVGGCYDESCPQAESGAITLRVSGMDNRILTYADPVYENVTVPLHVWIYKPGEETPTLYFTGKIENDQDAVISYIPGAGFDFSLSYDVYVLGMEGTVNNNISRTDLERMVQTDINEINAGSAGVEKIYRFSGQEKNKSLTVPVEVSLTRNVCRLDLSITGFLQSGTSFTVELISPDRTYVFSPSLWGDGSETPTGMQSIAQTVSITDAGNDLYTGQRLFFEDRRPGQKTGLVIRMVDKDNKEKMYITYLNKAGNNTTLRNTIYRVNFIIDESMFDIEALDWQEATAVATTGIPATPEGNTYILQPNGTVYIPVSQAIRHDPTAIGRFDTLTSELVWSEVKGIAPDGVVSNITLFGEGHTAVLRVAAGSAPGNALVAVKKDGNIVWSWNIWVTSYDPISTAITYSGVTFMGCNIGATNNSSTDPKASLGNYYQWGRKDPFPLKPIGNLDVSGTMTEIIFKSDGTPTQLSFNAIKTNTGNTILNPTVIYLLNDWLTPDDWTLWGSTGKKTVYDPCPYGWRVPTYADLGLVLPATKIAQGYTSSHFGYFPHSGWFESNREYKNTFVMYSSEVYNSELAKGIMEVPLQLQNTIGRGTGSPIRCVKDNDPE